MQNPPPPPHPVQNQPQWMEKPGAVVGCPPGLEYLTQLDQLLVHQQIELLEVMTGFETKNKYVIKNSLGQQCYYAYEESDLCERLCCGQARGFQMHIVDNVGQEVIRVNRVFKCCVGCCWCISGDCCAFTIEVQSPVGTSLGRIVQLHSKWSPRYAIKDANDQTILVVQGPCCVCSGPCCTADVPFELMTADESQNIGNISRQFAGFAQEMWTNATNFGIQFPRDLDVKAKALCLGALFLIDMMFFEYNNK